MQRFQGKVVLITGGSRGIGKAIAERVASEGATVAINYVKDDQAANELVASLSKHTTAACFQADVSDPVQCKKLVADVLQRFKRIDVLMSNAGVEDWSHLDELTLEAFDHVFHINVAGQLLVTQAVAPHLPEGGRIVLTSSVSATKSVFYHTLYAASKAAISAAVRNLAPELGQRGVTINAIAPGGTQTDMAKENAAEYTHPALRGKVDPEVLMKAATALGRLGKPEEIAAAVAFLASSDAAYMTGATLMVDGGFF